MKNKYSGELPPEKNLQLNTIIIHNLKGLSCLPEYARSPAYTLILARYMYDLSVELNAGLPADLENLENLKFGPRTLKT